MKNLYRNEARHESLQSNRRARLARYCQGLRVIQPATGNAAMTSTEMLAAAYNTTVNAGNFLAYGLVYSNDDKLAIADAVAILNGAAFSLSKPTPVNVDAMHAYDAAIEAASSYAEVIAVSKAVPYTMPDLFAVVGNF